METNNVLDQVKGKFEELKQRLAVASSPVPVRNEAVPEEPVDEQEVAQEEAIEEPVVTEPKAKKPRKKRTPSYRKARKVAQHRRKTRKYKAKVKAAKKAATGKLCEKRNCGVRLINNHMKWCATHRVEVRKAQTVRNNQNWRARKRVGKAGHHKQYAGKPTKWALAQRDAKVPKRRKAARK